jgi:sec-independent protein translocase protein TatB
MFGFSWSEILIIGVVALVLIGPNDLPRAMKTAAKWMAAGRKLAREFQGHVDDLVREAELDELREQARKLATQPLSSHLQNAIDPHRELADALSPPLELSAPFMTASSSTSLVADPQAPPLDQPPLPLPDLVESPPPKPLAAAPESAAHEHANAVPDPAAPVSAPQT